LESLCRAGVTIVIRISQRCSANVDRDEQNVAVILDAAIIPKMYFLLSLTRAKLEF